MALDFDVNGFMSGIDVELQEQDRARIANDPMPGLVAFWGYLGRAVPAPPLPPPDPDPDAPAPADPDPDAPAPAAPPAAPRAALDLNERWRLYFNPHFTEYVEFKRGDMVQVTPVTRGPNSLLPGHIVWLNDTARIQFVRVATLSQSAGFLRGPIASIPASSAAPSQGGEIAAGSAGCGSLSTPCVD